MSACDYCEPGPIQFCKICETPEGNALHWEYVTLWHLNGCFPCDYQSPTHEWISMTDKWFIDQMQPHGIFIDWQVHK